MHSNDLSRVPERQRRLLALSIAPVAAVLLVAGVLLGLRGSLAGQLAGLVLGLLALLLLGVAHGLFWSARRDARERQLDGVILAAAGPCGSDCGSCGVDDCAVKALPRA